MAIISIDFDGTCVTHDYPKVGKDIGSVKVLKRLIDKKHKLILNTMRSDISYINDAIDWFKINDIPLYGINENPTQKTWSNSRKIYSNYYIDDAAIGIPLKYDENLSLRLFVDWKKVEEILEEMNLI
jgi:hypothetical protein